MTLLLSRNWPDRCLSLIIRLQQFGLCKARQIFPWLTYKVLHGLPFTFACTYDVLIASQNKQEHYDHHVFKIRVWYQEFTKATLWTQDIHWWMNFWQDTFIFPGHEINERDIFSLPEKIITIQNSLQTLSLTLIH